MHRTKHTLRRKAALKRLQQQLLKGEKPYKFQAEKHQAISLATEDITRIEAEIKSLEIKLKLK